MLYGCKTWHCVYLPLAIFRTPTLRSAALLGMVAMATPTCQNYNPALDESTDMTGQILLFV